MRKLMVRLYVDPGKNDRRSLTTHLFDDHKEQGGRISAALQNQASIFLFRFFTAVDSISLIRFN